MSAEVSWSALLLSGYSLLLLLLAPASLQSLSLCLHTYEASLLQALSRVSI